MFGSDELLVLLPERDGERPPTSLGHLRSRDFDMAYHLDCPGLCADFVEDIEFRFSLGPSVLIGRLLKRGGRAGLLARNVSLSICAH